MKIRMALFSLFLLSTIVTVHAMDSEPAQGAYRLEYVHFDAVTGTVQWGVSVGTINDAGDFISSGEAPATYSISLKTGTMSHDEKDGQLSPEAAQHASQAFHAVSMLMRFFTQGWDASEEPAVQELEDNGADHGSIDRGSGDSVDHSIEHLTDGVTPRLLRISAPSRMIRRLRSARDSVFSFADFSSVRKAKNKSRFFAALRMTAEGSQGACRAVSEKQMFALGSFSGPFGLASSTRIQ